MKEADDIGREREGKENEKAAIEGKAQNMKCHCQTPASET